MYVIELKTTHQYWKSGKFIKNLANATKYKSETAANTAIARLVKTHGRAWNLKKSDLITLNINPKGRKMKFKKGSKAARDHMAKLRAMRGKKKRTKKKATRSRTKKVATKKRATNPRRKVSRVGRARTKRYLVFKCKGNEVYFLALTTEGKLRWTLTRGDTVQFESSAAATRVAKGLPARFVPSAWKVGVVDTNADIPSIIDHCHNRGKD